MGSYQSSQSLTISIVLRVGDSSSGITTTTININTATNDAVVESGQVGSDALLVLRGNDQIKLRGVCHLHRFCHKNAAPMP